MKHICSQIYYELENDHEHIFLIRSPLFEVISTVISIILCYCLFKAPFILSGIIIYFFIQITSFYRFKINLKCKTIERDFLICGQFKNVKYNLREVSDIVFQRSRSWYYGPSEYTKSAFRFEFIHHAEGYYFCSVYNSHNVKKMSDFLGSIGFILKVESNIKESNN